MSITDTIHERAITALAAATDTDRREVAHSVAQMLKQYKGCKPTNPGNRRTARIAGKEYHWAEFDGRLLLADGPAPWNGPIEDFKPREPRSLVAR